MSTKKQQMFTDPTAEFPPRPKYRPDTEFKPPPTLSMGERLAAETARLREVGTAEQRAEIAAVEEQQRLLAPDVAQAHAALVQLGEWLEDNDSDLKLLRSVDPKAVNGRYHDPDGRFGVVVKNAIARTEELFSNISQARDHLAAIETRVARLTPQTIEPRVFMRDDRFSTVFPRDGWYPREPAQIRVSVVRETRRVASLPRALEDARGAVAQLIDKVNQMERIAGGKPKKSEATVIQPEVLAARAAARPGREPLRAISEFSGYSQDNK